MTYGASLFYAVCWSLSLPAQLRALWSGRGIFAMFTYASIFLSYLSYKANCPRTTPVISECFLVFSLWFYGAPCNTGGGYLEWIGMCILVFSTMTNRRAAAMSGEQGSPLVVMERQASPYNPISLTVAAVIDLSLWIHPIRFSKVRADRVVDKTLQKSRYHRSTLPAGLPPDGPTRCEEEKRSWYLEQIRGSPHF